MNKIKQRIPLFYKLISVILVLFTFSGCPTTFVREVEKQKIRSGQINLSPIYIKSLITEAKLNELYKSQRKDSSGQGTILYRNDSLPKICPLNLEIRSVNAKNFPEEVVLKAYLFDSSGHYITGLAPPFLDKNRNFREFWKLLYDSCNGVSNEIKNFSVTEVREDKDIKHAISFVLDHSPSMGSTSIKKLQETVRKMLGSTKNGDYISVIKFTSKVYDEIPLTDSIDYYYKHFYDSVPKKYGDGTAIYDAVVKSVMELKKAPSGYNRIMILFTDGGDNRSKTKIDSALKLAKSNDVIIHSIALNSIFINFDHMIKFAEFTGGKFYNIRSDKEFPYVFADIYLSIYNYYRITFKPDDCKNYHSVNAKLYIPAISDTINALANYDMSVFTKNDPVGTIILKNIEFDFNKSTIKEESLPIIAEIAEALKKNENYKIEIRGHTDDIGAEEFNLKLSERRALAVKEELIKLGIAGKRLKTLNYGKSRPLVPNDNDENRKKNRRIEFVIIEK
ncbi:MAG: OmpA family protein [Candidatus Kapabacteria bacterium]|nr:OmpA family protein [Candidatus Kapabacteria bacterium]